jgi:hypothetical protein
MLMGEEWVQFGRHGFRLDRIVRYQEEEEDDPGGATGPDGEVLKRPTGTIRVYYGNRGAFRLNRPEADAFRRFIGGPRAGHAAPRGARNRAVRRR